MKSLRRINNAKAVNGTIWITSDGITIEIEKLDINLNGNNKQAIILLEDRKYSLIFLC